MTAMSKATKRIKEAEREAIETALTAAIEKSENNAYALFNQLLTEQERIVIGRRVLIANLILHGKTQMEINNLLNVSPNTYTMIRRWLDDSLPSYDATNEIERRRKANPKTKRKTYPKRYSFADLQKKFPLHFLLFTISEKLLKRLGEK
jgi:Trp operon repressor